MERAEYILSLVGTILSCMAGTLTIGIKLIKALKEVKEKINKEKIEELVKLTKGVNMYERKEEA